MNRFLIGESNPVHQNTLAKAFKQIGYSVDIVTNGVTLGKMMEREWYSHVLVDAKLPQFHCDEMHKHLEKSFQTHDKPSQTIALTTNVFPAHWDEALFDSSLSKPVSAAELKALLEKTDGIPA